MANRLLVTFLTVCLLTKLAAPRAIHLTFSQLQPRVYINETQFNSTPTPVVLEIWQNGGGRNQTSPLLYGWMFEDISVRPVVHLQRPLS